MKVLVVGSGGREHALVWKLAQSPEIKVPEELFAAPGNAGMAEIARCVPIKAGEIERLVHFARFEKIDLTVVGPEAPLVEGIVDRFAEEGLLAFGPSRLAARLEGSKVFAKRLMRSSGIPTGEFKVFSDLESASRHIRFLREVPVVKADGLAAGKGAFVPDTLEEALAALDIIMNQRKFGSAGDLVVIEERLEGEEASILAFSDGHTIFPMESCQDHKKVFDGDKGPNTGGMGAYSPAPVATDAISRRIEREILIPTIFGLNREECPYRGVLYAGLMITKQGPKVLEFNVRFGDPETQPLLVRMKSDLLPVLVATVEGNLENATIEWDPRPAVCVVMASGGYPGAYEKGKEIHGLEDVKKMKDVVVFHAGTRLSDSKVVTAGGRVLGVTALGNSIAEAKARAYEAVSMIHFEGAHYRKDIADKAISRLGENIEPPR